MKLIKYPNKQDWPELLRRPEINRETIRPGVRQILDDVRRYGDKAVNRYEKMFGGALRDSLEISPASWEQASSQLTPELKTAIDLAIRNITLFHAAQAEADVVTEIMPGIQCWRRSVGIEKVGLYIPGGTAPLFSTLLMLAIPARLAGCREIIVCTPADESGNVHPALLYAAHATGVTRLFVTGGVQAIAAMAYGTESIPQVSKVFGPGNQYVTCAKMMLQAEGIAIDMPAGPSELAILADSSANPSFIAADLLSQAEHGADSQVILVSDDEQLISGVHLEIESQVEDLPRSGVARKALQNSISILVRDLNEGLSLLNEYAPEHLIIACREDEQLATNVINAGSVFLGTYAPESAGDYATGTNHTLPTNGHAKAYSGVSLDSFVKKITFQKLTKQGLHSISKTVTQLANAEGLQAHANAITIRTKQIVNEPV